MFKNIFVPTDGSELSRATVQRAVTFAKEAGARITAFFAKPEYPIAYFGEGALIDPTTPEKFAELANEQAAEYLGEVERECEALGVPCATTSATSDIPYEAIIEAAEKAGAELFVPPLKLCGDNAAMIGCQGYYEYLAGKRADSSLNAYATMEL